MNNQDYNWRTGRTRLQAIEIEVDLPKGIAYRDLGELPYLDDFRLGGCRANYNPKKGIYEIEIERIRDPIKGRDIFTHGHEESHAIVLSGELTKLYEETERLGLSFDFLGYKEAKSYDSLQRMLIETPEKNLDQFQENLVLGENLANIGGLIALIKSGSDQRIIDKTIRGIRSDLRNPYPVLTEDIVLRFSEEFQI